jgi:hypothetical protein
MLMPLGIDIVKLFFSFVRSALSQALYDAIRAADFRGGHLRFSQFRLQKCKERPLIMGFRAIAVFLENA